MRGRAVILAALVLAAVVALGAAPAPAGSPNVSWSQYLPAMPSSIDGGSHRVANCRKAKLRCIRAEIRRLDALRDELGCDHRAVFATTYLVLTRELKNTVMDHPRFFRHPRYLFREDALFANVYFRTVRRWDNGKQVPDAWRIAFETAETGEVNGGQDMLLGINAHVQNDMPFVLAALGLRTNSGKSRKNDHDRVNEVLADAYEDVVDAVAKRYDPIVSTTNADWHPIDDVAGLQVVQEWREDVWRNAERLLEADSHAERRQIADEIEANAAGWATAIAAPQTPGDRARRDAYCAAQLDG